MAINHGNKPWQHWVYYWLYHGLHPIHTQKRYPETPQSQHIFGAGRMGVAFKALKSSAATRSSWAMEWLWLAMDSPYIFLSYSHDSIALKKAIYIYICGNDRNMARTFFAHDIPSIFLSFPMLDPHRAPGCVALPARSSDVGPSEIPGSHNKSYCYCNSVLY